MAAASAPAVRAEPAAVEVAGPPVERPAEKPAPLVLASTPAPAPAKRRSLAEKYRPRHLADVVGQSEAVAQLQAFAADPYPAAFILAGHTGVGKTSAAWALAADLGCAIDASPPEFGGVYSIPSGEQSADALRELWPQLWTHPWSGSGWKLVIVNEVEQLNGTVEKQWLDRLEELPPSTVIVFTTNSVESLPERFRDRCIGGVIVFTANAEKLDADARALAQRIWTEETGGTIPADVLDKVITRATQSGRISFRRVVQNLVPLVGAKGK
jgi:replication-associated recombination protein RarA